MTTATRQARDDFRKKKELDEARKAGTAPAETDESGKDINPHIPQYISEAPWYLKYNHATLTHQREDDAKKEVVTPLDEYIRYKKGVDKSAPKAKKYRKGACENCGAMTHKTKECIERPRKLGAKFSNKNIAHDEYIPTIEKNINFEGKHDRWRGWNPAQYQEVVNEYEKVETEKRRLKALEQKKEQFEAKKETQSKDKEKDDSDDDSDSSSDEDTNAEDKYAEDASMIAKFDAKNRVSVRNLRIREDTAKYLRNLDVNSAYYDPKTRTMRSNPYAGTGVAPKDLPYAGDNFIRYTDEVVDIARRQVFAWDASTKGEEVHAQADPTLAEFMHKRHKKEKESFKKNHQSSVVEMYGGAEHLQAPPQELLLAQSENYVEYSKQGRVIKGQEKSAVKSKYIEDVHPGNHQSVWGSFWRDGRWGYECCHSMVKESYCTGEAGKQASQSSLAINLPTKTPEELEEERRLEEERNKPQKSMVEEHQERMAEKLNKKAKKKKEKKKKRKHSEVDSDSSDDEDSEEARKEKIKNAMKKQAEEEKLAEQLLATNERDRKYGALSAGAVDKVSEEEMEAFRLRQKRADDPMSQFDQFN